MTAAWMAYTLVVGALVAAAALGLERAFRLAGRPGRLAWAAAIATTLALAAIAPRRAPAPADVALVRVTSVSDADGTALGGRHGSIVAEARAVAARAERALSAVVVASQRRTSPAVDRWLLRGWAATTGALLLLLAAVHLRFLGARRRWPVAELHGAAVRVAPDTGPAVVGVARPDIVVPRWLLQRTPEEQRLVIAHEQEHLRARDPLLLAGACAATALLAWHPAAWWMLSRLRLAVELDCDERVLRRGAAPRSYGTLLIDLAGHHRPGLRVGAAALADQPSHLERRLLAMRHDRPHFPRVRAAVLATLSAVALLVACEAKLPTNADVANMDVASATASAERARIFTPGDTLTEFTVDGVRVTGAQAQALKPDEIATIDIEKHLGAQASSQVHITTRKAAALAGAPAAGPTRMKVDGMTGEESGRPFTGVVLIDGVRSDLTAMRALDPHSIVRVEVIKGAAAGKLYDAPEAVNGVIRVTTKRGANH